MLFDGPQRKLGLIDLPREERAPIVDTEHLTLTDRARAEKVRFTARLIARLRPKLESVMYYPHPFTRGGFVIVFKNEIKGLIDSIAEVYRCIPPPDLSIHCLRRSELFELALPGLPLLPHYVSENLHLGLALRHKGTVLYGLDLRAEIPVRKDFGVLLANHLEGCMMQQRAHCLLTWLQQRQYLLLIDQVDRQFRYLMGTALLAHDVWDIQMETLPEQFAQYFCDQPVMKTWGLFDHLRSTLYSDNQPDHHAAAFEAVWLLERFLGELKEYTQ